jgi:hypothetical protein
VRIPNLIMQGLIAGAVLFIPAEAFAEKEDAEKRNVTADQNNQSELKQDQATDHIPKQAERKENVSRPEVSEAKPQKSKEKTRVSNGSEKSTEVRQTNPAAVKTESPQKKENTNGIKKSVPQGQLKKNVPIKQSVKKKAETSSYIHTEAPKNKSVLPYMLTEDQKEKKSLKRKNKEQLKKLVPKLPIDIPSEKIPVQPASKAIPVNAGQSSSHSTSGKDVGNGAAASASFKANLVLPLIFTDSEKVSVYFSRMDLLRSQWVNAPPSRPPETAL